MTSNVLKDIEKAYKILKEYDGRNTYILRLKNSVYTYKVKELNSFDAEYILSNHDKQPIKVYKTVKVADWWGLKQKEIWGTEFTPSKIKITWLLGETDTMYHFFCIYRRSLPTAVEVFAPKSAILTDFTLQDWNELNIDFEPYNNKSGRTLYPYQEEAVKFLIARKRGILASEMGSGKTLAAIVAALEDKYERILIICPASVKTTWQRELELLVSKEDITIVNGNEWKENKFTIINYDILKNFYTVPTEVVKRNALTIDENGNVKKVADEKTIVSRKKKVVAAAMEKSQLYQSSFDLMIIDEAHRLSNTTSGIFKIVSDLVKRSNPKGIYAITGTPITNRPINFFNILKIIGAPLAKDWKNYVERYCDGQYFFKKEERNAYTAMYCHARGKNSWYDLTYNEKKDLDNYLLKNCKTIWKTDGASNLDELQEIIKPYYLRRLKSDFGHIVDKNVKVLSYELTARERAEYDKIWDEYIAEQQDKEKAEKNKAIIEGTVLRQWLASSMIERTIALANTFIEKGEKVVIFCSFDDEIEGLKNTFNERCVVHNGKMSSKQKDKSVLTFQNDPSVKVFIGNIHSAGVGITLVSATVAIFNSFSWVSGDNLQAEDRIHRLNQTKDVKIFYQIFNGTFYKEMFEKVRGKQDIISNIIISENEK